MAANSSSRAVGVGRVLIAVYAILALAATGRSVFQIIDRFSEAPLAFSLSGLSALVYILATVALIMRGDAWYRVAWATIGFEFVGVIVVGSLSVFAPSMLGLHSVDPFGRESTVWSAYGLGYLLIPLALPVLGMIFLYRHRPSSVVSVAPVRTVGS
jgi:hypothetical protein